MKIIKVARYIYYSNRLKVFESAVLSEIFGSKGEYYENGENGMTKFMICIPKTNIICVIRSRKMRRAGHVACMGEKKNGCRVLVGKPERAFLSL
jgi:hypothetical protein